MVAKNVPLWTVTTWDKKYNAVEKEWQPNVRKYKYLLSDELDSIRVTNGNVRLLYTGKDIGYTTEELAGEALSDGEIVSIPWGGTPSVKYYKGKFVTGDNRIAISNNPDELLTKYLYYYLRGHLSEIASYYRGAGLKHPAMRDVLKMPISYPSADEQRQIIQQFDVIERIIESRQQELQKLDELIKARFVELFGNPINNEKGWNLAELNSLCEGIGDGLHGTPEYDETGEYPFINGNNLMNGVITITPSTKMVNESTYKKHYIELSDNAILLSINGTLGKLAFYNGEEVMLGKSACYCNLKPNINREFVYGVMRTDAFMDFLESNATASTIKNVGLKAIRSFKLILPPAELQEQFVEFSKQIDKSKVVVQNPSTNIIYWDRI